MNATTQTRNRPAQEKQIQQAQEVQRERRYVTPPVNVRSTEDEYILEIEMPGVEASSIQIRIEGNELTVTGRRKQDRPEGELVHGESSSADFRRVFEFFPDIDTSRITAELKQGVLKLHLPKVETAKPRKIQVVG
jgi:HSP20 family protein